MSWQFGSPVLVEAAISRRSVAHLVVLVDEHSRADLRWAINTLTTNGLAHSRTITVIAFDERSDGTAVGVRSGSLDDLDELSALVRAAEEAARLAPIATDAAPVLGGTELPTEFRDEPVPTSAAVFAGIAEPLGAAFRSAERDGIEWFGYAEHTVDTTWLGTSLGLRLRFDQPSGRLEATAKSHERSRSVWTGRATNDFTDVSIDEVDAELRERLAWNARRIDVEPGRHSVILPAGALTDLIIPMLWSAGARDAREGVSAFSASDGGTRIGESLSPRPITISSDPFNPLVPSAPFVTAHASSPTTSVFDNGLALEAVNWIDSGTLRHLSGTRAEQDHTPAARNGTDNVIVDVAGANGTLADVIARTERGLLLTCLWYIREVDMQTLLLTGLTRDGVYVVEDGKVVGASGNFRFNVSPLDLLTSIADAGASGRTLAREWGEWAHRTVAPAVRVEGFNLSTRSDAL